ncbi:viperin family antiviral radical SAM protein [Actinacidiphila sp. ITFR-21]|uniref:viperin family antiviral radical SAM protein n=1 Tax=Actinacidiphila sp. ITFR-21 TaxID=3075199 RepID=UPI00288AC8EB|nr:viperin family antiviral radical SAM protein [Streptomyces sp. ITFR-21]WNI15293.1 viperin family antiviral radical SAM protein [Streptomyces sp. ITFR-21]
MVSTVGGTARVPPPIKAVNFHIWQPCNMHCGFCFAQFKDVRRDVLPAGHLPARDALRVVDALADEGFQKITFAGGEPFLCPWLPDLVARAHQRGMVTSIVTNGSLVKDVTGLAGVLDWLVLSVDSLVPDVLTRLGRTTAGRAIPEHAYRSLCLDVRNAGISLKINTVVTRANLGEDLSSFLLDAAPRRWKILQMLPIDGQNGGYDNPLRVTDEEFRAFASRHLWVARHGIDVVCEDNDAMTGSYAMLDPAGRFFDNVDGHYSYSESVLSVGAAAALRQVTLDRAKFLARGGQYDWRAAEPAVLVRGAVE